MTPAPDRRRPAAGPQPAGLRRALPAAAAAALAAVALLGAPGSAQEGGDEPEAEEPLLVEAPRSFRLAATGSAMLWEEASTRSPDDGSAWGLEIERLLLRWAFARLGASFGSTTVVSGSRSADVNAYLLEVFAGPRFPLPALREAGVVPFLGVGVGSVVHDPEGSELATRSQNAFSWGGGVEWSFRPGLGVRAEWRRYAVDMEDLFAELDRTGDTRDADRIQVSVFWAF